MPNLLGLHVPLSQLENSKNKTNKEDNKTRITPNLLRLHVPLSQLELPSHQVDDRVRLASSRHFKRPRKTDFIKIRKERKSPTSVVVMNNPHLTS